MVSSRGCAAVAAVVFLLTAVSEAQNQNQELLTAHNTLRANLDASNMRQLEWSTALAARAQKEADACDPPSTAGERSDIIPGISWVGSNRLVMSNSESLSEAVRCWYDAAAPRCTSQQQNQVRYASSSLLGCGRGDCENFRGVGAPLLVCYYAPGAMGTGEPYIEGDACADCPDEANKCTANGLCSSTGEQAVAPPNTVAPPPTRTTPGVTNVSPNRGSVAGGTEVTISGRGFSTDQFNFQNASLGNRVFFTRDGTPTVECDVVQYSTNENQIVCTTRPAPLGQTGAYTINILVDGAPTSIGNRVYRYNNQSGRTPTVQETTPLAFVPGEDTVLNVTGDISTIRVTDTQVIEPEIGGTSEQRVTRMLVGGEECDPRNETNHEYGGQLNTNSRFGTVRCRPVTNRIDSMNVTLVLSEFGNSDTGLRYYSLDNKLRHYLVQSHPDITRVEPNVGSAEGGTLITIYGQHFNDPLRDVRVNVGGVPCEIQNFTANMIQCVTGPAPPPSDVYPGGRGLAREVWTTGFTWNLDTIEQRPYGYPNVSANNISIEEKSYRTSDQPLLFGEDFNINQRYTGFFVPPLTSDYIFSVRSDDNSRLFLSPNTSRAHKELVAEGPQYTRRRWNFFSQQTSRRISLEAGKSYYVELLHGQGTGPWTIGFGVKALSLNWTDKQALADHEVQEIVVSSTVVKETQRVMVTSRPLIQTLQLSKTNSSDTVSFQLQFGSDMTTTLATPLSSSEIQSALNSLSSVTNVGSVQVNIEDTPEQLKIIIIVITTQSNLPRVLVVNGAGFNPTVDSSITQSPSPVMPFSLGFGNRVTPDFSLTMSTTELKDGVLQLFTTNCLRSGGGRKFLADTYDINLSNRHSGTLDNSVEPYCGRYSLRRVSSIPLYIYSSTFNSFEVGENMKLLVVGQSPTQFRYVCFAYIGTPSHLVMRIPSGRWYLVADMNDLFTTRTWRYVCFNVYEKLRTQMNTEATELSIDRLAFQSTSNDFWIDELVISTEEQQVTPVTAERAARPGGVFVDTVTVTGHNVTTLQCSSPNDPLSCQLILATYTFTFDAHHCGHGMPLMSNSNNNSRVTIERIAAGSPPVTGHFDLGYQDNNIAGIMANTTGEEMTRLLEENFGNQEGFVVTLSGGCAGQRWRVRWAEKGGDQPSMNITGSDLNGVDASVTVNTLTEGGVYFRPLRGDMLRLPELTPQVEVIVNGIPASCRSKNCSFDFAESTTPHIVNFEPKVGGQNGESITIYVADIPDGASLERITIGNAPCNITAHHMNNFSCTPSPQPAGYYPVKALFSGIGFAVSSTPFQYSLRVDAISVNQGGVGGGNVITVSGIGFREVPAPANLSEEFFPMAMRRAFRFSPDYHVLLDGRPCMIVQSNLTSITCVPQPHAEGVVDLTVVVENQKATLSNAYEYTQGQTAVVHLVTPGEVAVFGGTTITVRGNNFGSEMADILIGNTSCIVSSQTNMEINCTTSSNAPGSYPVIIHSWSRGRAILASTAMNPNISRYAISLNNLCYQDNEGGSGSGDDPETSCDTLSRPPLYPLLSYTLQVMSFSPCNGSLAGGTEVTIEGEGFGSNSSQIMVSDGRGRSCEVTSVTSTLIKCRTSPHNSTLMASDTQVRQASFRVWVHGFEARYDLMLNPPLISNPPLGSGEDMDVMCPSCHSIGSSRPPMSSPLFIYSPCATPMVAGVYPNMATLISQITISGEQFGTDPDSVSVMFGGAHRCTPLSVTMTTIICQLDQSSQPPPFTALSVTVHVRNLGSALVTSSNSSIMIRPIINQTMPATGSIFGGNMLTINGGPFSERNAMVRIGDNVCSSSQVSYDSIRCVVPSAGVSENATIQVMFDSSRLALCSAQCSYGYSESATPTVSSISPSTIGGMGGVSRFTLTGTMLNRPGLVITIGPYRCTNVTVESPTSVSCQLDFAQPSPGRTRRQVGNPVSPPAGRYAVSVLDPVLGISRLENGTGTIISTLAISSVSPPLGSVAGATVIMITGYGFSSNMQLNKVTIGNKECTVTASSYTSLVCRTPPQQEGSYILNVTINGVSAASTYNYSLDRTPTVTSVSPSEGQVGDEVMISGTKFMAAQTTVRIGGSACAIVRMNETNIRCTLGSELAGEYPVNVHVSGLGGSQGAATFRYVLRVDSVSPTQGSFAGQSVLTVNGVGFNPISIYITVCNRSCLPTSIPPNVTTVTCTLPMFTDLINANTHPCDVTVSSLGRTTVISDGYTLMSSLTPRVTAVNRTRGGTGGGSIIQISGEGFTAAVTVFIASVMCNVSEYTTTSIVCKTGPSRRTVRAPVMVFVEGKGFAISSVEFHYLDLWSSRFTWGGQNPPEAGSLVVIPKGQTLVLDVRTEVMRVVLIQGGELIFDDEADGVELHSENIIIVGGGKLQVGTEAVPYQHKAKIVMYGHVLSTEIPIYGAKTLAVRDGTLDLHGKKIEPTWTRLSQTVRPGDTQLHLAEPVSGWEVDGYIVVASTSFSQRENEELRITAISSNRTMLTVSPPFKYTHVALKQVIEGRNITTSAEVGYLTRNIVVRGNTDETWTTRVENCPKEFNPGQFAVQTCFFGRFGAENIDDQFGSQIMLHKGPNDNVVGRIEYVEVTRAGQAFRLGRYPIHFHLNGDVSGSYVRGCGIHHTFNRAVTVHAVDNLLVEKNVAFNVLGHAYFLEDGNEQGNIIQDNLGVFVRASSSLLNVDITPATFWAVNPNNTFRRNAAAGGTHFGFWYRLPQHPTGPSFTTSISPVTLPLGDFSDNSAHSFGWYGLWVFPTYYPGGDNSCTEKEPAVFKRFLAWRNDKGVEFDRVGAVQVQDSIMLDNKKSGVEITDVKAPWGDKGAVIGNTLIVAHSELGCDDINDNVCTEAGVKAPHTYFLTVSNVTFHNFDQDNCYAIRACSFCRGPKQGGFETRFSGLKFVRSPRLTKWQWESEQVFRDLDGTLTGSSGAALIPSIPILPPSCSHHPASSDGVVNGSMCLSGTDFVRFAMTNPVPTSLTFRDLNVTNQYGTAVLPYVFKRLILGPGPMAILPTAETYRLDWPDGDRFTNLSYNSLFSGMTEQTHLWINHETQQPVDEVKINGVVRNSSLTIPAVGSANNGDWFTNTTTNNIYYFVKGSDTCPRALGIHFDTFRCFYPNCIPPPPPEPPTPVAPGRPNVTLFWSNSSTWPTGRLPQENEDVFINASQYVIVDVPVPKLGRVTILGGLELSDEMNHRFEADLILILELGRFVVGFPETPFQHRADIVLHGDKTTPVYRLPNDGPVVGSKAIGVLGQMILTGKPQSPTWTFLQTTVNPGSNQLTLVETVDWMPGEEIVISSTTFEANQAEVFTITEVSGTRVTINGTFSYRHLAGTSNQGCCSVPIRAEVGLLTRNIRIMNGDPETAQQDSFGCRVLVSNYVAASRIQYTGTAQLQGVEFKGCGQKDFVEAFDPRYSLAFLSTGPATNVSYVKQCSFHDGYNIGIGVFATNGLVLSDNVLHRTLGTSISVTGSDHLLMHNLAVVAIFPGTYDSIPEPLNPDWTANYEIVDTTNLVMIDNSAAGGARAGYHTDGENCISKPFTAKWKGNIAHSTLHGVHLEYRDGHTSGSSIGCSAFNDFTVYSCYHYGIFAYGRAGIIISNAKLVNNFVGVFVIVIEPAALSHVKGEKDIMIVDSHVVAAFDEQDANCTEYSRKPEIANHPRSHSGIQSPQNGHVGIITPSFNSAQGHFPKSPWFDISNYPAIGGLTMIRNVTFCKFGTPCGKTERALMTHPNSDDCQHPIHLENINMQCVDEGSKFWNHNPNLGKINPSDCVDMDCDGLKKILIRDQDGSFTGGSGLHTMVSRSELGWGERDPDRGISDLRIPRTMLANVDGTKKDAAATFPNKGIYRGSTCDWKPEWNSYSCRGIDHLMMVMESLDADTEVRRLSPIGLASNGYVDLINGPQDHGWCGGYTCQERISDFFMIVASGQEYEIGLTSTNPQDMRMQLINAKPDQRILSATYYTTPQRLDVYVGSEYVIPTNAYRTADGNINYNSSGNFVPNIGDSVGTNYYDRTSKKLYIVIRGSQPITIRTTAVVQVSLTVSVTVDDFFEKNLISNLAFLLNIPSSKIRIVSVISESSRRKRATGEGSSTIAIEIGDPPSNQDTRSAPVAANTTSNGNDTYNQTTPTSAPSANTTSYTELTNITTKMGEVIQTGQLTNQINASITGVSLTQPQPPPTDPTGGVRTMEGQGGPQPNDPGAANLTTFSMRQEQEENMREQEMMPILLSIPSQLRITHQPSQAVEGVNLAQSYEVTMYDNNNQVVTNLGVGRAWELTASITRGPSGASLANPTAMMTGGVGRFTDLQFSHPGDYVLSFAVTYPSDATFSAMSSAAITVTARQLRLVIAQQPPETGNTSFPLSSPTTVHLVDAVTGNLVTGHGWRGRTWHINADVVEVGSRRSIGTSYSVSLNQGVATFTNIKIASGGSYLLQFSAVTQPASSPNELPSSVDSRAVAITKIYLTRFIVTFNNNYTELVLNSVANFKAHFVQALSSLHPPSVRLHGFEFRPGSIIASFFASSSSADDLGSFLAAVTSEQGTAALSFIFRGTQLNATSVVQDEEYPFNPPLPTHLLIIIVVCSAVGVALLLFLVIIMLVVVCCCCKKKSKLDTLKIRVKPMEAEMNLYDVYTNEGVVDHNPVFHLVTSGGPGGPILVAKDSDSLYKAPLDQNSPSSAEGVEYVVSKEVKVGGSPMFRKPANETSFTFEKSSDRDYLMNTNNNNNNNNNNYVPPPPYSSRPSSGATSMPSGGMFLLPNLVEDSYEYDSPLNPPPSFGNQQFPSSQQPQKRARGHVKL